MKLSVAIVVCILLNNFCYSQVDYSHPNESNLHKLDSTELEATVIDQLNIDPFRIQFITTKELDINLNETVVVIGEIENEILDDETEFDYRLTSHILLVNSITGKIKYYHSENSNKNGWESNAVFISEISIDSIVYMLTKSEAAFGIKAVFRNNSQPNPYHYTDLSLYIKEGKSLKKVLDNLTLAEYTGVVNVNMNACYADVTNEKNELSLLKSSSNGYYDIQVKNTIINSMYELDAKGECEPVEKSRIEKASILKYNMTKYKL